jgi:hypothetical protein
MSPATASTIPGLFRPPEPPAEVEMVELQPAIAPVVTPPQGVTAIRPSASGDERGGRIITPPRSVPALSPPAPLKDPTAGVSPSASGSPPFRLPPVPESAPGARAPKPTPKKPARSPDGAAGQRAKLWGLLASIIAIAALTIVLKLVFDS